MDNIISRCKELYKKYSDILTPTIVLLVICIVVTLALSSTNLLTENKIAEITKANSQKAMGKLIEAQSYTEKEITLDDVTYKYFEAANGGELVGYIMTSAAKGYGGDVSVMTAVNTDGSVKAVEILDASNETPGLGQNVTKPEFYEQYTNKKANITVVKSGAKEENNEIDAWTGATITSKAVTTAVNDSLDVIQSVIAADLAKGGEEQ